MLRSILLSASCPFVICLWVCVSASAQTNSDLPRFEPQELPVTLQVGYAVRAIDINADKKLDIAIVDSKRVLWLENPTWKEHVIYETPEAKFDNVCFAPHDINGDGKIDLALGADWQFNNAATGGTIGWLQQTPSGPWIYRQLATEPTTHRMNWIDLRGNNRPELVVGPLKGKNSRPPGFDSVGIRLLAFLPPADPASQEWSMRVITDELHVMHNFEETDLDRDGRKDMVAASYEGATWIRPDGKSDGFQLKRVGAGQVQAAPAKGASEIRHGRLRGGIDYLATVEPWHGDKIVVYLAPQDWLRSSDLWPRFVLDQDLAWGHAVACANLDQDEDQELIIGIRDDKSSEHRRGVRIFDPIDAQHGKWNRTLLDPGAVAVEDLVAADLDGDGDQDIVAVGRATHNAKVYWNTLK